MAPTSFFGPGLKWAPARARSQLNFNARGQSGGHAPGLRRHWSFVFKVDWERTGLHKAQNEKVKATWIWFLLPVRGTSVLDILKTPWWSEIVSILQRKRCTHWALEIQKRSIWVRQKETSHSIIFLKNKIHFFEIYNYFWPWTNYIQKKSYETRLYFHFVQSVSLLYEYFSNISRNFVLFIISDGNELRYNVNF